VEVQLFAGPTARVRSALEASTQDYGRFLGQQAELHLVGE
jgi:hypothetical protein